MAEAILSIPRWRIILQRVELPPLVWCHLRTESWAKECLSRLNRHPILTANPYGGRFGLEHLSKDEDGKDRWEAVA